MRSIKFVVTIIISLFILSIGSGAFAGDDPTIPAGEKVKMKAAMKKHIKENLTPEGYFKVYDDLTKKNRNLKFDKLHKGVVREGFGFLVCADFKDGFFTFLDVDIIVVKDKESGEYKASKAIVHKVNGIKRAGHLDHRTKVDENKISLNK